MFFQHLIGFPVLAERSPRHEGNPMLLAVVQQIIPFAVGEAVAVLDSDNRNDLPRPLQMLQSNVRQRHMTDLSLLAQPGQCADRGVEGHGGVRNVKVIDIDPVEAQAFQAAFERLLQMLRAGIVNPLAGADSLPSALGGDHQAARIGR